jgi:RNA polymerase sigma-70 factor (ECF subfamily)
LAVALPLLIPRRMPALAAAAPALRIAARAAPRRPRPPAAHAAPPAQHDAAGFEATVLPLRRDLFGAALRLTRRRADAEDLVQDTLMRGLAAWSSFIPGSNCRAWLHRILTNAFISGFRRRRRHARFTSEAPDDALRALHESALDRADPTAQVGTHALGDEVAAALDELAPDYRTVVELADLEGMRYRDIADRLGVPIGTVMSRLFRARRLLEARLAAYAAERGIVRSAG